MTTVLRTLYAASVIKEHSRDLTDVEELAQSLDYHLRSRNRKPRTIEQYQGELARFTTWLGHCDLRGAGAGELERYFAEQAATGVAPATVLYRYKGLQAVYRWHSKREGYSSPMLSLEPPTVPETQKDIVSASDLKLVLGHLDRGRRYREAALVSLLMETGIRASELSRIDWSDVDWKRSEITLADTKNGDIRTVPFGPRTGERLDLWRTKRRDKDSGIVFTGQRGGRMHRASLYRLVTNAFKTCGIDGIGPHDLRHTMATAYMDANPQGMEDLKVVGGWKSDTMVRRYSRKGRERRGVEAFRANNPMGSL